MSAFGIRVPKRGVTLKNSGGGPALELALPGLDVSRIGSAKFIDVGAAGPRYLWEGFSSICQ